MKGLAQKVHRFLVSEDGPTAVEYAVMLALIIIVCLTAISAVGTQHVCSVQQHCHEGRWRRQLIVAASGFAKKPLIRCMAPRG